MTTPCHALSASLVWLTAKNTSLLLDPPPPLTPCVATHLEMSGSYTTRGSPSEVELSIVVPGIARCQNHQSVVFASYVARFDRFITCHEPFINSMNWVGPSAPIVSGGCP